ncbi:MAG: AMP-binding protein, partial [Planctomycetota bacterium]
NCLGAVHVPIHGTLSPRQAADQLVHSESKFAIIENEALNKSVAAFQNEFPGDLKIASYEQLADKSCPVMADMLVKGDAANGRQLAETTAAEIDHDAVTTILYTSGTTGEPKGIMLSQRNLVSNAVSIVESFTDQPLEVRLNFLPLSHIFGRMCDLYTWLVRGSELALTQSRDTIIDDCKRFRPTMINGVPFFFERVRQKLEEKGKADQPGILQELLGGRVLGCFSGGGALHDDTYKYYISQDVPLMQGYGLTESSPVISFSNLETHGVGQAGQPLIGVEVKIAEDDEILTRGPHVMLGYWKDSEGTKQVIRDGWLHTGDLGTLDEQGRVQITGRKKEMIVTATGKNVFPSHVEALLCRDPLILQAVVFGDKKNCLSALIVPDPDVLKAEIKKRRLWVFSKRHAVRHKKIVQLYRERIDEQLKDLAHHEQVPLFKVLHYGFTIESGYMTAKLSLRRNKIEEDFVKEIDAMYTRS